MLPIYYFQKLLKGLTSISIHVNNSAANTTNQPTKSNMSTRTLAQKKKKFMKRKY